jgi:YidC/Oxa1 family membrane protein insertase
LPPHEALSHAQAAADALYHLLASSTDLSAVSSSGSTDEISKCASAVGDLADAAVAAAASSSSTPAPPPPPSSSSDWLAPVANSLEASLTFFQRNFAAAGIPYSYGWAIIALTAATKVATFPFTRKQVESALAVQKLKPAIDDIKRQYGENDKEAIQRETSALYEKAGVDPSAGCLPTLLTLPVFWGLYRALTNVAASGDASVVDQGFFWIPNLSGPTSLAAQRAGTGTSWLLPLVDGAPPGGWAAAGPYLVLPVLLVAAQYASSAIISPAAPPKDGDDEGAGAQFTKALVGGLPLLVGWFALNVPSGIALYYFANTVLTSAVQIWLRKLGGATAFEFQQEVGVSQAKRSELVPSAEGAEGAGEAGGAQGGRAAAAAAAAAAAGSSPPRAGEVGALEAAWLLDFDAAAVVREAMATIASRTQAAEAEAAAAAAAAAEAQAAGASADREEQEAAAEAAAALAALPVATRSKRRRAGGLPEGAASKLAEQDERERKEREGRQSVGAGLLAAVRGQHQS